jgi:phenylpyruvate tautomerase
MPYLMVQTNTPVNTDNAQHFVKQASATVSRLLGKPESYVMVSLQPPVPMVFAGTDDPTAYLELKSIGLPEKATPELSKVLCELVRDTLNIDENRIYVEFSNAQSHLWGWNGRTF